MFNPYGFQGGTATLDPQATGMNGHARIAEAMSGYAQNITNPQNLTGAPIGQPNVMPNAFPNFSPVGYGYPTYPTPAFNPTMSGAFPNFVPPQFHPGFQPIPTPFGFAGTPATPWVQPTFNPYVAAGHPFVNAFAPVNNFTGMPTINPFVPTPYTNGYVNPMTPFAGFPIGAMPNFVPGYTPSFFNPQFGGFANGMPTTTPFFGYNPLIAQTPVTNPVPGIRAPIAQPTIGNWFNPYAPAYNAFNPTAVHPFFSNTASLSGLVNPFLGNGLGGAPVGNLPPVANPLVVSQLTSQYLAAGVDPLSTATIIAWNCGCNPAAILPLIQNSNLLPLLGGNVNPAFASRLPGGILNQTSIVNPWLSSPINPIFTGGTFNPFVQPPINGVFNPFTSSTISPWNNPFISSNWQSAIPGTCGLTGCITPGGVNPIGGIFGNTGIPGFTPGLNNLWSSGTPGFGGLYPTNWSNPSTTSCWPSYCI